jgi:NAD-dependent dihydropyrimidine dehydrogenase PreA subunit
VPFLIGAACIDVTDRSCMDECPVDCIYEGDRKLYINPNECIDCGACEPVCPVQAVSPDRKVSPENEPFKVDNQQFFELALPGREAPLGSPGGARKIGRIGVDTPFVAAAEPKGD